MLPNKFFCYRPVLFKEYPLEERGGSKRKDECLFEGGPGKKLVCRRYNIPLIVLSLASLSLVLLSQKRNYLAS